jgi:hypothetical protein
MPDFSDPASYYPGSLERRQTVAPLKAPAVPADDLGQGIFLPLRGRDVEFFMIGQLAFALGRRPGTLRKWESQGILPTSGYTTDSKDPRGKRRLYTRRQCEGIIRIAVETGILDGLTPLADFGRQVHQLFLDLKGDQ